MRKDKKRIVWTKYVSHVTTKKALLIICLVACLVYYNMLFNGFVWDDLTYIVQNTQVHALHATTIFGPSYFNEPNVGYYRPIPAFYFSLLYVFFQNATFPYHVFQLLLHVGSTMLLYFLFKKFFSQNISLFLALIFLVHPVQVESVSYISQTVSPLFFFFGIIALLLSMKENPGILRVVFTFFFLFLSFSSKETGFLFLLLLLLYRFIFTKDKRGVFILFSICTSAIYFLIRFAIGHVYFVKITNDTPIGNLTFTERITNIPLVIFSYLKTFFYPVQLVIDQKWIIPQVTFSTFYMPLCIDILFFLMLSLIGRNIYQENRKQFRVYLFFFCWFILGIGMHSQIIPLDMTVADRWMYFALAGLVGIIGVIMTTFSDKQRPIKRRGYLLAIIVLVLLSARTMIRNTNFHDDITLNTHDSKTMDNADIENNLAVDYESKKEYKEALPHFQNAVSMNPTELNLQNIATTYEEMGEMQNAGKYFAMAVSLHAANFLIEGQPDQAMNFLNNAVISYPNDWELWLYLALANDELHKKKDAMIAARNAQALNPNDQTIKKLIAHQPFTLTIADQSYQFLFSQNRLEKIE